MIKTATNGFVPYLFKYDTVGRLVQVQREQYFLFLPANTVNASFVYNAARTSSSPDYPNLSATVTSHWGQATAPTYAAAVFDNQTPIGFSNNTLETIPVTDARWRLAKFYFTNATGTTTNTATYGKTHWLYTANLIPANVQAEKQISYASYDAQGIENVLNRFNLEGNDNFDETQYATIQKYATSINNIDVPDGVYLTDVWSETMLSPVTTRVPQPRRFTVYQQLKAFTRCKATLKRCSPKRLPTTTPLTQPAPLAQPQVGCLANQPKPPNSTLQATWFRKRRPFTTTSARSQKLFNQAATATMAEPN
jgi:hypothetical protein